MRQRLGRWLRWVTATRARRSAVTLAVPITIASLFIIGTYDPDNWDFYTYRKVSLTPQTRAIVIAKFEDCYPAEVPPLAPMPGWQNYSTYWDPPDALGGCPHARTVLQDGGYQESHVSRLGYFVFNGALMLATLVVTFFALTAAMAAMRKWWRWWW
jgi:hypothetical protein